MDKIPALYRKNGYDYQMVSRSDLVAIYEQKAEGKFIAFEVCEIIIEPDSTRFGTFILQHERLPGTNDWGKRGFTLPTLEAAKKKAEFLAEKIINRKIEVK